MISVLVLLGELAILACLQSIRVTARPDEYMLVLILIFSMAYFLDLIRSKALTPVKAALLFGYMLRIALLLFDLYGRNIYCLPNGGSDAEYFYILALRVSKGASNTSSYLPLLTGTLFRILGTSRLYIQFLLTLNSVVSLHMADRLMRFVKVDDRHRKTAMYILCLLPNYAILSVLFLRESTVTMLIAISLLLFVRWWSGKSEINFLGAFLFIILASLFHSGAMGVAMGYILVCFFYNRTSAQFRLSVKTVLPSLVFMLILVYLYNNYADELFKKMLDVETISDVAAVAEKGGSSYAAYVGNSDNLFNMIIYTPIRMLMFQFSPFIWQIRGVSDIIALCFDSTFYIYTYYQTIRYIAIRAPKHRSLIIVLFIIGLMVSFVFAWGVTNTGTAIRHRDKMIVIYAVLLGLTRDGLHSLKSEKKPENALHIRRRGNAIR